MARTTRSSTRPSPGGLAAHSNSTRFTTPPVSPIPENPYLQNPYAYHIGRGETGVLTIEPYKSALLPHWRFRTPAIARQSATELWAHFLAYEAAGDFVGMDMARKFIQMGMTRAARYANYKGGRKYAKVGEEEGKANGRGVQLERSKGHEGKREKEEASQIFREVWERCKAYEGYLIRKEAFLKGQKQWERERKSAGVRQGVNSSTNE